MLLSSPCPGSLIRGFSRIVDRNSIQGIRSVRELDTHTANGYNNFCAEVAQAVEQRTENPRVTSSILVLGTTKRGFSETLFNRDSARADKKAKVRV